MVDILLSWLILSAAVWFTAVLLPGIQIKKFSGAIVVALIFGLLNWSIGWLLFTLIGIATLGIGLLFAFLTRWIVCALLLEITSHLTDKMKIKTIAWSFLGALVMSALGTVGEWLIRSQ